MAGVMIGYTIRNPGGELYDIWCRAAGTHQGQITLTKEHMHGPRAIYPA
jgi:hypothetical protein